MEPPHDSPSGCAAPGRPTLRFAPGSPVSPPPPSRSPPRAAAGLTAGGWGPGRRTHRCARPGSTGPGCRGETRTRRPAGLVCSHAAIDDRTARRALTTILSRESSVYALEGLLDRRIDAVCHGEDHRLTRSSLPSRLAAVGGTGSRPAGTPETIPQLVPSCVGFPNIASRMTTKAAAQAPRVTVPVLPPEQWPLAPKRAVSLRCGIRHASLYIVK
jgi:hypothetical protein